LAREAVKAQRVIDKAVKQEARWKAHFCHWRPGCKTCAARALAHGTNK
jgi:hypothetical protein